MPPRSYSLLWQGSFSPHFFCNVTGPVRHNDLKNGTRKHPLHTHTRENKIYGKHLPRFARRASYIKYDQGPRHRQGACLSRVPTVTQTCTISDDYSFHRGGENSLVPFLLRCVRLPVHHPSRCFIEVTRTSQQPLPVHRRDLSSVFFSFRTFSLYLMYFPWPQAAGCGRNREWGSNR